MCVFAITQRFVFCADAEGIWSALSRIARIHTLVTDFFVDIITGVVCFALRVVFTGIRLSAYTPETNGSRRAVECCRTGGSNSTDLVFNTCFTRWLTGVKRITNESGGTDALEASDHINTVRTRSTRISLKAFVYIFASKEWISMKSCWTYAFNSVGPLKTGCALTADNVFTAGNCCTRLVRVSTESRIANTLIGC